MTWNGRAWGGDILRGGAPAQIRGTPSAGGGGNAPPQAAQARAQARDSLARTTRALRGARSMQQAARAAAQARAVLPVPGVPGAVFPAVPNGLVPGGLQLATSPVGALNPVQKGAGGAAPAQVTVTQNAQQALLTWNSFNIGRDTRLRFDQSAGGANKNQWIAFNKVNDPTGVPSQILGSIQADGQVYVINQNGIMFGGASQVNAHTLVASALPINDNLIQRGLLNQSGTAQFLFSGLPQTGDTPFTPPPPPPDGKYGNVTVLAGAQLTAPTTDANVGGRVALIGANVENHGTIATPDGQTILAAGLQVGFTAHSANDPSLRGLDAYVGQVGDYAGTATNDGLIEIPRGSAAITGRQVNQFGVIASTTSVSLNGRVDLRAEFNASANSVYQPTVPSSLAFIYGGGPAGPNTGQVSVGRGSVTSILPEWGSPDKVIGTELALRSQLNIQGRVVHLAQDSFLHAPSGSVSVATGLWDFVNDVTNPSSTFVRSGGQIYVDRGAVINVAGTTDAFSPLEQHILTVTLRSSELADAPLQRDTFFRGGQITVDLRKSGTYNGREWVGTPLADLRGYRNIIERTVDELTVAGGSVSLNSGGSVIVQEGAVIDTSAGWLNYGSGSVQTTRLLVNGSLVDIAAATPDRLYDSVYTGRYEEVHSKWNVTRTYEVPWMTGRHFEQGYFSGAGAGNQLFAGSSMALDGIFRAGALSGPRQTTAPARGGTLDLRFDIQKLAPGVNPDPLYSPTPPAVVFNEQSEQRPAGPFALDAAGEPQRLRGDRVATVVLTPGVFGESGFAALRVRNPDGNITVPGDITLRTPVKGAIALEGSNVSIYGDIISPGGSLTFLAYNISPSVAAELLLNPVPTAPNADRGVFRLGTGGTLNTAGQIVDYRPAGQNPRDEPYTANGGSVSIKSYMADLLSGGLIDVSGGVVAAARGGYTYGNAGSVEILAGQDLSLGSVDGGRLRLDSTLKAFSGTTTGGSLSLQAQLMQVGGTQLHPLSFRLRPDFFSQGGFSSFNLIGLGEKAPGGGDEDYLPAVSIAAGVEINPEVLGWLVVPYAAPDGQLKLRPIERPEGLRAPLNLTLTGRGIRDELAAGQLRFRGDVLVGQGSRVLTDARGSIRLVGDTVAVFGNLIAPSGSISLSGANSLPSAGTSPGFALTTVYLAPSARLSAAGAVVVQLDRFGRRIGSVDPGGSITLSGNIVAERGAVLDVSGTSGALDLHPTQLGLNYFGNRLAPGERLVPFTSGVTSPLYASRREATRLESAGGSISLRGAQMLFTDATLRGDAGGPTALGGVLSVASGRYVIPGGASNTAESNLVVTQAGQVIPVPLASAGMSAIGLPVRDGAGAIIQGMGYFTANAFQHGGFSSLSLGGNVEFRGPVAIQADNILRVATGGVIRGDASVRLTAEYAALGQAFAPPVIIAPSSIFTQAAPPGPQPEFFLAPQFGAGELHVTAQHIDLGNLTLQGIGKAALTARGGDIRGNGTFQMAGSLVLTAAQVYPTTASSLNIVVYDGGGANGSIAVERSGSRNLPWSAAGTLTLFAGDIRQEGVLRAPFGTIQLGWDGAGTVPWANPIAGTTASLPITASLVLGAGSQTSVSAVDPRTGTGIRIPYGTTAGGESWISPAGADITAVGPPEKKITLGARTLDTRPGSLLDLRGGGELFAYEFIPGAGGSRDVLSSTTSFAILPGFDSDFSPYGPFNTGSVVFGLDTGYINGSLQPGDKISLGPNHAVLAGSYVLLPARYALLHGAYLVTPLTGAPVGSVQLPDGSVLASGYRHNSLNPGADAATQTRFELASGAVIRQRSRYGESLGNRFFADAAANLNLAAPRLPQDSGRLTLQAVETMALLGQVLARPLGNGRGSLVDINSPIAIVIGGPATSVPSGSLLLNTGQLNAIGAESLLVGGVRSLTPAGTTIVVNTGSLVVDNAGEALSGADIILVARDELKVAANARIRSTGNATQAADRLIFGSEASPGSGNGVMVRASADETANSSRRGVTQSGGARLIVAAGSELGGGSITLDSTSATSLSPDAMLAGRTVNLSSGQISIQLDDPGPLQPGSGLVLAGQSLASLVNTASTLNLLSYSSIDLYGTGAFGVRGELRLSAGQLRGFNQAGGTFTLQAPVITLDNRSGSSVPGALATAAGTLMLDSDLTVLGAGQLRIDQFEQLRLNARDGLVVTGAGGLLVQNDLLGTLPTVAAAAGARYAVRAGGTLALSALAGGSSPASAPGGALLLEGREVEIGTRLVLPSGSVTVRSTAGDLRVGGQIVVSGTRQDLNDLPRFTNGGEVRLETSGGDLVLASGSLVDVSAHPSGGDAGVVALSAPAGTVVANGDLLGRFARDAAGRQIGRAGSIELDLRSLAQLSELTVLDRGEFFEARTVRVRTGDVLVDGTTRASRFRLAADDGSITVTGRIDASGSSGGQIALAARGSVSLATGSGLSVRGLDFNTAGKGGSIRLEAGVQRDGVIRSDAVLDLGTGAEIDLGVASMVAGDALTIGTSAFRGQFAGTLHLRAPQSSNGTDVAVNAINATIAGASSILVEGYRLYDLSSGTGGLSAALQGQIRADAESFLGVAGAASPGYAAIMNRLLAGHPTLEGVTILAPGVEVVHRTGDLTLGNANSTATDDWNLAAFRFGPKAAPGVLTLRAAGDLVFYNSLSDGFNGGPNLWLAPLMAQNPLLPVNTQAWSYRLTAGADHSSVVHDQVLPLAGLAGAKGSLLLGKNYGNASFVSGATAQTATAIANGNRLQVIRTGSGDIEIAAGRDVQLLNVFSTIYSAGTQVARPTGVFAPDDFNLPIVNLDHPLNKINSNIIGAQQQLYPAQYTMGGGNVSIRAGADIARSTRSTSGALVDDTSRQIPTNWLYRRGFVDPLTGEYGRTGVTSGGQSLADPSASTTWWVDYSSFFQGIGALGGGNVSLVAGNDVRNVDAVAPTNARAPGGVPDASRILELGGGDVSVRAGADIHGGNYYVERGHGSLVAGASITLDSTRVGTVEAFNPRSPSLGILNSFTNPSVTDPQAWIPTLLFLGKGGFDLDANGDVTIGPVVNPFLLTSGIGNKYYYKTYFSTFDSTSSLTVNSLAGDVTHRLEVTLPNSSSTTPTLQAWLETQSIFSGANSAANRQPWLRPSENSAGVFGAGLRLHPGTVRSTALAGDIRVAGTMTLSPAPKGTLELAASGGILGLNDTGVSDTVVTGRSTRLWSAATINVSDASPAALPNGVAPDAYHSFTPLSPNTGLPLFSAAIQTSSDFFTEFNSFFAESGSYQGVYAVTQTRQALHDAGILHRNDPNPVRLYALGGDVSGLTLFTPKSARVLAGQDLADVALYLQNVREGDVSVLAAGRDLTPYNPNSALRTDLNQSGGLVSGGSLPLVGDLQLSGPGVLEVLSGRKLTLGAAPTQADGTGDGISSIANFRNPFLPSVGGSIVIGAGIGAATSLVDSDLDFESFINTYVRGGEGAQYLKELGVTDFEQRSPEDQALVALDIFYLVLRDTGINYGKVGNYDTGTAAIDVLFGGISSEGAIDLSSRGLKTRSGGDINIFAPSGGLTLGSSIGSPSVPPGIITEAGGNISIATRDSVDIGVLRIFTLRGGDIIIWSSEGDIAAGSSSKTVASAPPTRVVIDPQSADVATDLAGLSTGGGIGVLATVKNVEPGNVTLVAPLGAVDAGDAGIRSAGNLSIAAAQVLNASNIAVTGTSAGTPAPPASAPAVSATAPVSPTAATANAAQEAAKKSEEAVRQSGPAEELPSLITVEVIGYGGGETPPPEEDEEAKRRRENAQQQSENQPTSGAPSGGSDLSDPIQAN